LWLLGPKAEAAWNRTPVSPDPPSSIAPSGGVHVLRGGGWFAALRAGSYGQRGIGGHGHNDQLALVLYADQQPIVIDPGTGSYTGDPVARDRFRGTAAHATVVVAGAEQSPILPTRPFALLDRAHGRLVEYEDLGSTARLAAEHSGYRRLPSSVVHRRRLILYRWERVLVVQDELEGRGEVDVEVRFPLAVTPELRCGPTTCARLAQLAQLLPEADRARAIALGQTAALVPLGEGPAPRITEAAVAPAFGQIERGPLVSFTARPRLPAVFRFAFIRGDGS
jgi:uncharacterized heparinase superfamily protein